MTLIERLRTIGRFWVRLKGCDSFALMTVRKAEKHIDLSTIAGGMSAQEEVVFILARISALAKNRKIHKFEAVTLLYGELSRLITMQAADVLMRRDKISAMRTRFSNRKPTIEGAEFDRFKQALMEAGLKISPPPKGKD